MDIYCIIAKNNQQSIVAKIFKNILFLKKVITII